MGNSALSDDTQIGLFGSPASEPPAVDQERSVPVESLQWKEVLKPEFEASYFVSLKDEIKARRATGTVIHPPDREVFAALSLTPLEKVKVVILGQDPYHGEDQAHGLCFSVKPPVRPPPSLLNIFRELHDDLGIPAPGHGSLVKWAKQGVLLLNAVLTVEAGRAGSHHNLGWEQLTDQIVTILNEKRENLVFLLWGSQAQKKGAMIDPVRHFILKAPHPSPLSAHRGFLGCKHFSKTNEFLRQNGIKEIDWNPA